MEDVLAIDTALHKLAHPGGECHPLFNYRYLLDFKMQRWLSVAFSKVRDIYRTARISTSGAHVNADQGGV